jgi:putative ABC transport system substrate-binding protein
MTRRRPFLVMALAAVACSSFAQPRPVPHVGFLWVRNAVDASQLQAFREGLGSVGLVEGRDVVLDEPVPAEDYEDVPRAMQALLKTAPSVVVTYGGTTTQAFARANSRVPVVMVISGDPLQFGLVDSLAHPGRNVTGYTMIARDAFQKRIEALRQAVPSIRRVAEIYSTASTAQSISSQDLAARARSAGVALELVKVNSPAELEPAIASLRAQGFEGVVVNAGTLFHANRHRIIDAVEKARLPTVYASPDYCRDGGFLCYGVDVNDGFRRAASYVARILRGASPADLPVERADRLVLVVNEAAARRIGVQLPSSLVMGADEVVR